MPIRSGALTALRRPIGCAVPEEIRFHFDPICPWSYQTSLWVHRLAELGEVRVEWAVFSLQLVNAGAESGKGHGRSAQSLRTAIAVRDVHGAGAVGRFYAAIGRRVHELGEPVDDAETIAGALTDAGFEPALFDKAIGDEATWAAVEAEHRDAAERLHGFGVPTIVHDGGAGPAIFGPVVSAVPTDADAVELWRHVAWLTRYENFSELKRERTVALDLPAKKH